MVSIFDMDRKNMNITYDRGPLGMVHDNNRFLHMANIDFTPTGQLITSASCPGDSGGPVFVYATTTKDGWFGNKNITYAIQVGILSGTYGGVSI